MLSLYWKIFIGFWVSSMMLSSAALYLSHQIQGVSSIDLQGISPIKIVQRTAFIVRRLPDEIIDWQRQLSENDIHLYFKKKTNSPLTQQVFDEEINRLFNQLNKKHYYESSNLTRLQVARKETSINGDEIKFIIDMPSRNILKLRDWVNRIGVQFSLALALSALICFVLARYLTRNIKQLSITSKALADGDLSARVTLSNLSKNDELSILGDDFNKMASALEDSTEQQKRLVRDISHELRSPLARLQISLELAKQKGGSKDLDRIDIEANRLNDLIGQLLSMPDQSSNLNDTIDLIELTKDILNDGEIEAQVKKVKLKFKSNVKEALVSANLTQLQSALENIVRNAIKYTDEDTYVNIEISEMNKKNINEFNLEVSDSGPGVPNEDLKKIFEPFYRVDQARNRKTGGFGIGLSIVKRVIKAHGGRIEAINQNKGLAIKISLPKANV